MSVVLTVFIVLISCLLLSAVCFMIDYHYFLALCKMIARRYPDLSGEQLLARVRQVAQQASQPKKTFLKICRYIGMPTGLIYLKKR